MHISSICDTFLSSLSKIHDAIPVQIVLDFLALMKGTVLMTWNLKTTYSLFVSVNFITSAYFSISFKQFFLVFLTSDSISFRI